IADGAEWIWKRVERLRILAEIPAAKLVEVLDFYHASQYLSETIATCRNLLKAQRRALYKRLRHALRHQTEGVEVVQEALRALATPHRSKAITRALGYVETHAMRMRYVTLEARKLPLVLARSRVPCGGWSIYASRPPGHFGGKPPSVA